MERTRQFCTFFVDDLFLCLEVERVQEVLRPQEMTFVPLASKVVSGLINLRGQIVTAVDLRRRLDLPDRPDGQRPMNIVVRAEGGAVALLVDEIGDVLEVNDGAFERPPETLHGVARDMIRGIYKLKGQLLLVLDAERAIGVPVAGERPQGLHQ
jgi:purine-binding chemotaxis protein CheW